MQPFSWLTVLTQDTVLFADTVKRNILYGRPSASDEEIDRAAGQGSRRPHPVCLKDHLCPFVSGSHETEHVQGLPSSVLNQAESET